MSDVRVRFAPSPTGYLHIGGVRTALFNWLFARQAQGTFVLRIEDTDRDRSTDEAIDIILAGLRWVGLDWEEGPYRQTDRLDLYRSHAMELLRQGQAYWCVCTPEDLEQRRMEAQACGGFLGYDGRCRERGITDPAEPAALRFRSPCAGVTTIDDLIKGTIQFDNALLDDLIVLRSNGYPTYNFSVVVDDALMKMTHVIRGDDHVNNTPRQVPLFNAFGYAVPQFAHLPMILGADKTRLSKRHGATSVLAYRDMGYLPEALVNYLVRLGWSHGDQEIFSRQELVELFSFRHVQSSAAVFNPEKLLWVNAQHLRAEEPATLASALARQAKRAGYDDDALDRVPGGAEALVVPLRERSQTLNEMVEGAKPYLADAVVCDDQARAKYLTPVVRSSLVKVADRLEADVSFEKSALERVLHEVLAEDGVKMGKLAQPLRVALTGGTVSPGIYDVMALLGKERTLSRLRAAIADIPPAE